MDQRNMRLVWLGGGVLYVVCCVAFSWHVFESPIGPALAERISAQENLVKKLQDEIARLMFEISVCRNEASKKNLYERIVRESLLMGGANDLVYLFGKAAVARR